MSTGNKLMEMMLRPVLGYGYEVANPSNTAFTTHERVHLASARQLLGTPIYTKGDAIRGELGWWTMAGRMDKQRLLYLHRLQRMPSHHLARKVFIHRMDDARRRSAANQTKVIETRKGNRVRINPVRTYGYCHMINETLQRYKLDGHYATDATTTKEKWKKLVISSIQRHQEDEWRNNLASKASTSPVAQWYQMVKSGTWGYPRWGFEEYLADDQCDSPSATSKDSSAVTIAGKRLRTLMRTYSAPLAACLAYVGRKVNIDASKACPFCNSQEIEETPSHLLVTCPTYHGPAYDRMMQLAENEWYKARADQSDWFLNYMARANRVDMNWTDRLAWHDMDEVHKAAWLLSFDESDSLLAAVNEFLVVAFGCRKRLLLDAAKHAVGPKRKGKHKKKNKVDSNADILLRAFRHIEANNDMDFTPLAS